MKKSHDLDIGGATGASPAGRRYRDWAEGAFIHEEFAAGYRICVVKSQPRGVKSANLCGSLGLGATVVTGGGSFQAFFLANGNQDGNCRHQFRTCRPKTKIQKMRDVGGGSGAALIVVVRCPLNWRWREWFWPRWWVHYPFWLERPWRCRLRHIWQSLWLEEGVATATCAKDLPAMVCWLLSRVLSSSGCGGMLSSCWAQALTESINSCRI